MPTWNVVATSQMNQERRLLAEVGDLGSFWPTGFREVIAGLVPDPAAFLELLRERWDARPFIQDVLSTVTPMQPCFPFTLENLLSRLEEHARPLAPEIGEKPFYVRVKRRGHKGELSSQEVEQALDRFLKEEIAALGLGPTIDFKNPEVIVAVEIIHNQAALGLITRELKARYRGSFLGFLWTFLNPLLLLAVYALVFHYYLRIRVEHYAGFMFVGLLPWIWFSSSLLEGTTSITSGGSLVTKVLFPSQILPMVKTLSNLVNYLLSLPILYLFLWGMGVYQGWSLLWLPLILLLHFLFIQGWVLLLSAVNVFFRDVQHILANLLTLWFFLTPILYPLSQVPAPFRPWVLFNPMAQIIQAYHDVFFYHRNPDFRLLAVFAGLSLVLLWLGASFFERYKESFAEKI